MTRESVREFFDAHACNWDREMITNDSIIATILDNANIKEGSTVLDVGCGTGVLVPYYLERSVASVTAVDLSPNMVKIAESKFSGAEFSNVQVLCADATCHDFGRKFDAIVIYNAFPHFLQPEQLISHLCSFLNDGGIFTVAHGMSRDKINEHHKGCAKDVSLGLMEASELSKLFDKYLDVTTVLSNDKMYQVAGRFSRKRA